MGPDTKPSQRGLKRLAEGLDRPRSQRAATAVRDYAEGPELTGYGNEKENPGIELTEPPPRHTFYEPGLKLELPEDVVLPYEWPQESDWYWRVFRVPAALLNRTLDSSTQRIPGEDR
jgi:hypothetical protein